MLKGQYIKFKKTRKRLISTDINKIAINSHTQEQHLNL